MQRLLDNVTELGTVNTNDLRVFLRIESFGMNVVGFCGLFSLQPDKVLQTTVTKAVAPGS